MTANFYIPASRWDSLIPTVCSCCKHDALPVKFNLLVKDSNLAVMTVPDIGLLDRTFQPRAQGCLSGVPGEQHPNKADGNLFRHPGSSISLRLESREMISIHHDFISLRSERSSRTVSPVLAGSGQVFRRERGCTNCLPFSALSLYKTVQKYRNTHRGKSGLESCICRALRAFVVQPRRLR